MKTLLTYLSKKSLSLVVGSRMDRDWCENGAIKSWRICAVLVMLLCLGVGQMWGTSVTGTANFGSGDGDINIDGTSVSGKDDKDRTWTVTSVFSSTTNFSQNPSYSQVGSSSTAATSITFTMTLPTSRTITSFSAKFGGNSGSAGTVTLKVGETTVGSGTISASSDVVVTNSSNATGTVLTVTVASITKGIKCYYISYTYDATFYTVTWNKYGEAHTTTSVEGYTKPSFPSDPSSCSDVSDHFYGWTQTTWSGNTDDISGKTTDATKVYTEGSSMPIVTEAVTYHAVFAKKTYGAESSVSGGDCADASAPDEWTTSGTGTYSGHGVKFDGEGDYIQSDDISSSSCRCVVVKLKAGHNGGSGSVLTVATLDANGDVIASGTVTPTDGYTSQTTTYSVELESNTIIKYVRVTMTSKTNNLGMEYCEVFNKPITYSKYITACCDPLGSISGSVTLTTTTRTMTATWSKTSGDHETGYSVQLYDNNGSGAKGSAIGDPVSITGKETANRTYTFEGLTPNHQYFVGVTPTYSGDGNYCEEGTEVTGNATTDAGYTVTYVHGSGATGEMTDPNSPYDAGATVTVLSNTFEKCGAVFNVWSAVDASSNPVDVSSGSFTMPSSNVTITATWTNKQDEFLDYMHENTRSTRSGSYTTPPALSNTSPGEACEGAHYKFMGWVEAAYINEDGTLKDGFTLIPGSESGHCADNKTFYAIWAEEE